MGLPIALAAAAGIMVWFGIEGYKHGVIRRIVEIVGLILIFVFASRFAAALRGPLVEAFEISDRFAFFGSWILVLVLGVIAVRLLARIVSKVFSFSIIGWLDKGGGFVLGAAFGGILVSCLFILLLALPLPDDFQEELRENPLSSGMLHFAPAVYDAGCQLWEGDRFATLLEDVLEPGAQRALDQLKAFLEEIATDEPKS